MLTTLFVFFIILGVLVLVHEAGHFVVARRAGVKVEEFGFGLPPRLVGWYKDANGKWKMVGASPRDASSTIWSLNWLPLGGFVRIKGEQGEGVGDPDSFASKTIWQRVAIISAGVTMNVILAAILLTLSFSIGSPQLVDEQKLMPGARLDRVELRVVEVLKDSAAAAAGVQVGDAIAEVGGKTFATVEEFQAFISTSGGQPLDVVLERDHTRQTVQITPRALPDTDRVGLGVALVRTGLVSYPLYLAWWYGIVETFRLIGGVLAGFFIVIKNLITSQKLVAEVYGPVGIAGLVGDAVRLGWLYVIQLAAVLSVILAVVNYLPIPALDGGRALFLVIEKIRGRAVSQKIETAAHNIGFLLLMLLILVVTFRDIARLSGGFVQWWARLF